MLTKKSVSKLVPNKSVKFDRLRIHLGAFETVLTARYRKEDVVVNKYPPLQIGDTLDIKVYGTIPVTVKGIKNENTNG